MCFNNNKSKNQSNKQKAIIPTHKQNTYWKADIPTAEEKKKKAELCTETLHILSDGIFVFFSNKKHETNEDVKHEMQILWLHIHFYFTNADTKLFLKRPWNM